jgi:hypothetical protein
MKPFTSGQGGWGIALAGVFAVAASTVQAQPADAGAARLMSRLATLSADSMEGRRAGTPGSRRARRRLVGELTTMGARPVGASFEQPIRIPSRAGSDTLGANITPGSQASAPVAR